MSNHTPHTVTPAERGHRDAFTHGNKAREIARLLRRTADDLDNGIERKLRDVNGNAVGFWTLD